MCSLPDLATRKVLTWKEYAQSNVYQTALVAAQAETLRTDRVLVCTVKIIGWPELDMQLLYPLEHLQQYL